MTDFEAMYFKLMAATEDAVNILIKAQRLCEEIYINAPEEGPKVTRIEDTRGK